MGKMERFRRKQDEVDENIIKAHILRTKNQLTFQEIGRVLNVHHTTVIHYLKRYDDFYTTDSKFKEKADLMDGTFHIQKIENTIENKKKFSSLYWGQRVLVRNPKSELYDDKIFYADHNVSGWESASILSLKNIENITDEDAITVAKLNMFLHGRTPEAFVKVGKDILYRLFKGEKYITPYKICLSYDCADFLRGKGYAIPFQNLSVKDLVDYGWIILE